MGKTLSTELVITEQCNLDCAYCYMKDRHTYLDVEGIIHFVENVHKVMEFYNCDSYSISYFGGEPLMNWKTLKEAITIFNSDLRCKHQVIISNGLLLTAEKIDYIKSNGVGFSFSFDGIWQNENRPHITKDDVFSVYMEKRDMIKDMSQGCKVMVSPPNITTMTENFEFFVEEFGYPTPDFSIVRDDIWSRSDVDIFKVESRRLADKTIEYFESGHYRMPGLFNLPLLDMYVNSRYGKRQRSCFAGCAGIGYMPDRTFYPCARYGSDRKYMLMDADGNMLTENLTKLYNEKLYNPSTFEDCDGCSIREYCNTGCNYSQISEDEDGNLRAKPVENVCKLFRIYYDDTLYINDKLKNNKLYISYIENIKSRF